jgi:two-component system, OmpR family, response regulator ArlR
MKILIIEDEASLRETMATSLTRENFLVETAADFNAASDKIGIYEYDCIVLDIELPGGNGLDLLKELRSRQLPQSVIIVSARNSLEDKIEGLDLGADDYLAKPFHLAELHARVKSIIRRHKLNNNNWVDCNNLKMEATDRRAQVQEQDIELNRKEFDTLFYLLVNKDRLVTKSALAEHVWGDYIDSANSYDFIYSQIKNLRKKLKDSGADCEIQAVYGVGYKLTPA